MLKESRLAPHFEFYGDKQTHFGIFEGCGTSLPYEKDESTLPASDSSECC
jgi:arsenite methyltransferase